MGLVERLYFLIGFPNRGQARGLRSHHVDAAAEVSAEGFQTGANKFQHLVLHKSALKSSTNQSDGHVVRTDTPAGRARHVHQHHLGCGNVPGVLQQLLRQLRSALAHAHGAQRTVAGVAVRAQDHTAALGQLLSCKRVDNRLIGGYVDAAVLLGGGQTEYVIVLIDGAAHGAQTVVAVGHGIGQRKLLHTGGTGGLDDTHVGDIVRHHSVELNFQIGFVSRDVVGGKDAGGDGILSCRLGGHIVGGTHFPVNQVDALVMQLYHFCITPFRKLHFYLIIIL